MRRFVLLSVLALAGCPHQQPADDESCATPCDDGNPCTLDGCEFGQCEFFETSTPAPPQNSDFDCLREVCQSGGIVSIPDDTEVPELGPPDDCRIDLCADGGPTWAPDDSETPPQTGALCYTEVCSGGYVTEQAAALCNAGEYCDAQAGCEPGLRDLSVTPGDATVLGTTTNAHLTDFTGLVIGDFTGDTVADLAVSQPDIGAGAVFVVPGPLAGTRDLSTDPGHVIVGANIADRTGLHLATCDFDGDHQRDLVIAAPDASPPGLSSAGTIYGIRGPITGDLDLATATLAFRIDGVQATAETPDALVCHDLDGDHIDDLVIGSERLDALGRAEAGGVVVFLGGTGLAGDLTLADADVGILGHSPSMHLGGALAVADLDHDGEMDLAIGAPRLVPGAQTVRPERVVVVWHATMFAPTPVALIDTSTLTSNDAAFLDGGNREQFGFALATGDLDADGTDDLAIGALLADPLGRQDAGEVDVVYGSPTRADLSLDVDTTHTAILGFDNADETGIALAIGDHNGDGRADLAFGAHAADGFDNARADSGEVLLFLGGAPLAPGQTLDLRTTSSALVVFGAATGDHLGKNVQLADLDADGKTDLLLAAPFSGGTGAVSILYAP